MKKLFFAVLLIAITLVVGLYFNSREECSKYNLCFPKRISWFFSLSAFNPRTARINEWLDRVRSFAISHPEKRHYCSQLLLSEIDKVDGKKSCIYLRNHLIEVLAEIGDPSIIEPLMKEVVTPKEASEAGCTGRLTSSLSTAIYALIKMGKRLDEIPVKWDDFFCKTPSEASMLLIEIMTYNKNVSFDEWQSLKLTNNEIIDAGLVALKNCKNDDCIFWLAPLMTHVVEKEKVVSVMESLLREKGDIIRWSSKYSLEKSLNFLKGGNFFCISGDLYEMREEERNYAKFLKGGVNRYTMQLERAINKKRKMLTKDDYRIQKCLIFHRGNYFATRTESIPVPDSGKK